jgi:hypothetical protein
VEAHGFGVVAGALDVLVRGTMRTPDGEGVKLESGPSSRV